jgi:N-acetylmuramoyl-L-alanine amidase
MAIICAIDAGHGRQTPGKRSPDGSLREWQFNSAVAGLLVRECERLGFLAFLTAPEDTDVRLATRTARAGARNQGGDKVILASIHANAGGGHGVEAFYAAGDDAGERLARLVVGAASLFLVAPPVSRQTLFLFHALRHFARRFRQLPSLCPTPAFPLAGTPRTPQVQYHHGYRPYT